MPTIAKKKTKMIVKDGNGGLLQLLPETEVDAELDEESSKPVACSAVAEALSGIEDAASNMGAIKVMDEEPTALNTTEYTGETLFAWVQPENWSITIDTELAGDGEKTGQIPFDLCYLKNTNIVSLTVNWGDGTTEIYSTENDSYYDYTYNNKVLYYRNNIGNYITHEYAVPGIYTIEISSMDFPKIYISGNAYNSNFSIYLNTLININSPLPSFAGIERDDDEAFIESDNSFYRCFAGCINLESVPANLFENNLEVTSFYGCFSDCTSLQSIPSGLFDKNVAVTNFSRCFEDCSSLQSIPSGLFDKNVVVTSFESCFNGCTSLQSIPEGLFDSNTQVTNFSICFQNCSSIQFIPEGLFVNNTAVTSFSGCLNVYNAAFNDFTLHIGSSVVSDCSYFVSKKTGTTRTIYVPSGSTTQTTFNAQASSLGLTIIGE